MLIVLFVLLAIAAALYLGVVHISARPEVDPLHFIILVQKNVLRLYVSMHDPFLVNPVQTIYNTAQIILDHLCVLYPELFALFP